MGERRGTKALELWCKRMTEGYLNVKIDNMTTSWRNGLAFCAMVHHFRPDLIDFDKLDKNDIYYNNDLAFRTAEQYLGIPALLDADDMASYEVPDRLSILTYLSQFYQVFASQDSPNRLKRNSTTTGTGETPISKSVATPPKMAHIVGVPKREPCQKCCLPVFLAERQIIGKLVYHRTCLKCARCKTQLTPGSFYETEIDGEFCCETCPDEEQTDPLVDKNEIYQTPNLNIAQSNLIETKNIRSSIADRLAFFEMNSGGDGKKFLQKSLSDEEKSQSLKRITEFKPNIALSNFINSTIIDDTEIGGNDFTDGIKFNENSTTECNSANTSVSLHQHDKEHNSLPSFENKLNIMLNIRGTIDTEISNTADCSTISPMKQNQSNNDKYNNNNLSVNITKDDSNSKDKSSNLIRNINSQIISDDLQQQSVESSSLHEFDETSKSESENNSSLQEITSDNDNNISISRSGEMQNISINLDDKSNKIIDTNNILICKEEGVPKFIDNENQDNFKLINNMISDNINDLQENEISNINDEDVRSPIEENKSFARIRNNEIEVEEKNEQIILESEPQILMNKIYQHNEEIEKQIAISDISCEEFCKEEISTEITLVKKVEPHPDEERSIIVRKSSIEYPEELNPFQSDDDEKVQSECKEKIKSLNPFSSDEDDESDDVQQLSPDKKSKPPRPPPPKVSGNPFDGGSDKDDENEKINTAVVNNNIGGSSLPKKLPIPTPRTEINSPLKKQTEISASCSNYLDNSGDYYGSSASLNAANNSGPREIFHRHHEIRGSNSSLASSTNGRSTTKTKKAHAPPPPPSSTSQLSNITKELFASDKGDNLKSSPNSSGSVTPQQPRKKRPAPKPPTLPRIEITNNSDEKYLPSISSDTTIDKLEILNTSVESNQLKSDVGKLSDEEKVAHLKEAPINLSHDTVDSECEMNEEPFLETSQRRLIPLDKSLLEDLNSSNEVQEEQNVVYRRLIRPPNNITTPIKDKNHDDLIISFPVSLESTTYDRQLEKMKDNKEAKNRNRQSQCSDDLDPLLNKSTHGKWKRRKGPAPSLPIPPRKVLQMLPLQEIRHELEIIEVQQQGLEKQGVILETMIRERCENQNGKLNELSINSDVMDLPSVKNSKEVEDLILQLFELVNEKNELFRRQAELMYLRRQHRLEQEQADLEYEIRVLMAQPERNKTDTDKAREESLIARMVEVVQLRNEVIECLDMDRLREAEEDLSIKQRLELHTAKRDEELNKQSPTKLSKKEKKKQKESKKLSKNKKLDADKDADESEVVNVENQKDKKKKKKFLF